MRELRRILIASLLLGLVSMFPSASAQQLAKRLILKDGSYQLSTQWEVKGDRVRYFSAERGEWEEVPKSMVDWAATDKYEKDRASGKPAPEAVELDKELDVDQQDQPADNQQSQKQPELLWDRFKIVRMQEKQGKRIAGDIKIAVYGKVSQEQKLVPTTAAKLTGGWVKVTPSAPLATGEYAVVELLGKEGMNFYVWDFGVNPTAPANPMAWKPQPSSTTPPPEKPKDLQQRQ